MSTALSLLLPGLLDKAGMVAERQADSPDAPDAIAALEWWLTLAESVPLSGDTQTAELWSYCGRSGPAPVAALSYYYDIGERPPGPVLRADPVYLAADRDCLRLQATELESLTLDQARQLCDEINTQFSDEPWRIVIGSPQRWYLLLDEESGLVSCTPQQALGRNILTLLPSGTQALYWRKIINEVQMLLYNCEINHQREVDGLLSANSLWLWGEGDGALDDTPLELPWLQVFSDDPVVRGMALWAGCAHAAAPADTNELLSQPAIDGAVLCQPLTATIQDRQRDVMPYFSEQWILPLYRLLQGRQTGGDGRWQFAEAEIWAETGVAYRLVAGKRRWWRRRQRLGAFTP